MRTKFLIGGIALFGLGSIFSSIPYAQSIDKINNIKNLTSNNGSCCLHYGFVAGVSTNEYYTVENSGSCKEIDDTIDCNETLKQAIQDKKNSIIAMATLGGASATCLIGSLINFVINS